jgi:hypothetical protein
MAGLNMTIGAIRLVVQHEIGSVSVKHGNNFPFVVPGLETTGEYIRVSEENAHITVEHQMVNIEQRIEQTCDVALEPTRLARSR